ncbi:alpha-glucosidase/alpha-galactosidase [Curtobacterium sp. MCBD17_003]|uniref:alpha-glucosidase/alpha-galactosidase n=1 Tax=Curtobacterium sp. MCBD17_003 TaxID=2175667 RepID=UPI000DA88573|nr:alpha-glucosidase/alpha-galactosidase [Curtobacterium sp. MCBD17_003]WIE55701.1 alpha-glucosidase/alpha-galactosidase [Curtobacterium sp. MCBD17_003]
MVKVAFIGAGSVEFTRNVVTDLCTYPELQGQLELSLHDIDAERLGYAEALAGRVSDLAGAGARISSDIDRRAALEGADFVINEIQVGGYAATRLDFDIPAKYGLRQTIGDTIGVGGIFRGLRTIPVLQGIGNDLAEVAPDSTLLNYSNPMAMLPWAVAASTPFQRVVGLCHSVRDTHRQLAELVGVPQDEIEYVTAGFNHQAFVLRFTRDGQDLYPRLREVVEADPELQRRVRVEIFRRFGYFPTESSEHSAEYVPWLMHDDAAIDRFRIPVGEYLRRSEENLDELDETKHILEGGGELTLEPTSEMASEYIRAQVTGQPTDLYVNVVNNGKIANLPDECAIEVPATVDADGLHPQSVGALPAQLVALNRTFLNVVELTVKAVLEGDRDHVYHAAMLDPNAAASLSLDDIHAMCDELLEAHGDRIPQALRLH